jgi:cobaltochelatase CobT
MDKDQCRTILRTALTGGALDPKNAVRSAMATLGGMPIALTGLASATGCQVHVVYGASDCGSTDGKVIKLMNLPIPDNKNDIDTLVLMTSLAYGLGYHELGHVSESDFAVLSQLKSVTPLVDSLFRIIEDVRMENAFIGKWPNTRKFLDSLTQSLYLTDRYTHVTAEAAPMEALTGYLLYRLYCDYRGDVGTKELALEAHAVCESKFSKGFMTRLDAMLPQLDQLSCTTDSLTMARNIAKFIEKAKEEMEQQPQSGQQPSGAADQTGQQGQGDQAPQDGQGAPGGSGDSQDQRSAQEGQQGGSGGAGDDQGKKGGAGKGKGKKRGSGSTGGDATSSGDGAGGGDNPVLAALQSILDPSNTDKRAGERSDAIKDALAQVVNQVAPRSRGDLKMDSPAMHINVSNVTTVINPNANTDCDMGAALAVTSPLRRSFRRNMEALSAAEVSIARRGRRMSTSHIHRVAVGDSRVFKSVSEEIALDTAVVLGLDASGSMSGSKIKLTCEAVYASAVALEGIEGVTCGAFTFPRNSIILPFGRKAKHVPGQFQLHASGGTPMDDGVYLGIRMLQAQRKPRKVMILTTDGEPNGDRIESTKAAVEYALSQGIEVAVMGTYGARNVCGFENWVDLSDITQLPEVVTQLFGRKLMRAA